MNVGYDASVDALYIRLRDGSVARTVEIDDGTNVDLDACGTLLGIEVIHPDRPWPLAAILRRYGISDSDAAMLMMGYPFAFSVKVA